MRPTPTGRRGWPLTTPTPRYAFLYRLHQVKQPAARAKRISNYIELLIARRTLDPPEE